MEKKSVFRFPFKPMGPANFINRLYATQGGVSLAMSAENAHYNGHSLSIRFNEKRGYWIAEYFAVRIK